MQRFYCTVCAKVKRVQHLPSSVTNPHSLDPTQRVGECFHHANGKSIGRTVAREITRTPAKVTKPASRKKAS